MSAQAQSSIAIKAPKKPFKLSAFLAEFAKYFILILMGATWAFPFFWMFTSAVKSDTQVYTMPPVLIPIPAQWSNFVNAWTSNNFNLYTFNTIFLYCIPVTLFTVVSSVVVAYGFSRVKWPGRDLLFTVCMITMMIPWQVTLVPLFITYKKLGWINSYLPLLVPALFGNAYFIFMLRQFFLSIPEELSDAARIDGANELQTLIQIILPLTTPALSVVALFRFLWAWNDFLGPMIYVNNEKLFPLAVGIYRLQQSVNSMGTKELAYPYLMAVSTIVALPIIVLFFAAQRTFIEGISLTGIKG